MTDGEFRRTFWHLDFLAALDGVKEVDAEKFSVQFKHDNVRPKTLKIVDKIGFQRAIHLLNIIAHCKKWQGRLKSN